MGADTHTPGPWWLDPYHSLKGKSNAGFYIRVDGGEDEITAGIAKAYVISVGVEQAMANGRLIAAAPDSLKANELFIAAIKQEYRLSDTVSDDLIYDEIGSALSGAYFAARAAISKATT